MKIRALKTYKDMQLERVVVKGSEFSISNKERIKQLISLGLVEEVENDDNKNYPSEDLQTTPQPKKNNPTEKQNFNTSSPLKTEETFKDKPKKKTSKKKKKPVKNSSKKGFEYEGYTKRPKVKPVKVHE